MNNGRVLFIIHDLYQEDNSFPLGAGYLAAVLKKAGVEVSTYCQDVFHYGNDELAQYLRENRFDLICVGFLAARFKETITDLCKVINQEKHEGWLVLGGHGPSPIPEYILSTTSADIVLIGESEETILDLISCKLNNDDLSKIKGIGFRNNKEIIVNPRRKPIRNLDSIPFPEWSLFPMEQYSTCLKMFRMDKEEKALGLVTSRGCINRCNFCYRMEKGIRFRSIKNVVEEIFTLKENWGISYFNMYDELFVYPKSRISEFLDELEKNDLTIKYACNARVDTFDRETAKWLKESGCQFLNFGMESSDQTVLDNMNKHTTVAENIRAAEITKEVGIGLGLNFIWGNIGDTEKSLIDNVRLIKKYNTFDQLRTIRPVTAYPGCDLYYKAIQMGLLTGPEDFFNKFQNSDLITVNFTEIPDERCYSLLYEANKDLILDHYAHTSGNMEEAEQLIRSFHELYFEGKTKFRGARHYKRS